MKSVGKIVVQILFILFQEKKVIQGQLKSNQNLCNIIKLAYKFFI